MGWRETDSHRTNGRLNVVSERKGKPAVLGVDGMTLVEVPISLFNIPVQMERRFQRNKQRTQTGYQISCIVLDSSPDECASQGYIIFYLPTAIVTPG